MKHLAAYDDSRPADGQDCQYRDLIRRVMSHAEDEKQLVARILGDELGQYLTLIHHYLQEDEEENAKSKCVDLLRRATELSRRLASELSPSVLEDFGLFVAIDALKEVLPENCVLVTDSECILDRFDVETERALYRILRQAILHLAQCPPVKLTVGWSVSDSAITWSMVQIGSAHGSTLLQSIGPEGLTLEQQAELMNWPLSHETTSAGTRLTLLLPRKIPA